MIDVCAHAPTKEIARAFMVDVGIANEVDGVLVPLVSVLLDEIGPITKMPAIIVDGVEVTPAVIITGWHVNVRYYGDAAEALTQGLVQTDGNGTLLPLFERTRILQLVSQRTGEAMTWNASEPPLPAGYVNGDGVRLFDPAAIATPARVWV